MNKNIITSYKEETEKRMEALKRIYENEKVSSKEGTFSLFIGGFVIE